MAGSHRESDAAFERGREDLDAIGRRYHSAEIQRAVVEHLTETRGWNRHAAIAVVTAFELLRWELLGVRQYPGMKLNISLYWQRVCEPNIDELSPALSCMLSMRQRCDDLNDVVDDQFQFAVRVADSLRGKGLVDEIFSSESALSLPLTEQPEQLGQEEVGLDDRAGTEALPPPPQRRDGSGYRVYDNRYDRIVFHGAVYHDKRTTVQARPLTDTQELVVRRQRRTIKRLARELSRRLLALSQPEWHEDIDEGRLYPARFSRVITSPHLPPVRLRERRRNRLDAVVCLLLDNSGSMRGLPIRLGLESCALLAEALDICGIKTEILGFTTVGAEDNRPWQYWRELGSPPQPGRLNSLRHIVYKTADQPWRQARRYFSTSLHPDLMQENIDGEALLWAQQRLLRRTEARRILIVIGDGKPCDPATREANGNQLLENHLLNTIERIKRDAVIELSAIGTSPAVARYYAHAVILDRVENLGKVLMDQAGKLFLP